MKRTVIVVLAVLALLLAACGSGDTDTESAGQLSSDSATETDESSESDESDAESTDDESDAAPSDDEAAADEDGSAGALGSEVLGRAIERTNELSSARFEGQINLVGLPDSDLPGEFAMTFSGAFDNAAGASQMTLDMGDLFAAAMAADPEAQGMAELFAGMFDEPLQVITIGDTSWTKFGLLAMFGVEDKWLEGSADADATMGMGDFGAGDSPTGMLEDLADADAEVEVVGQEEIRGVTTTHHRAELDLTTLAETMSAEERADFEASFNGAGGEGTYLLDLWLDDDDVLHRFQLSITDLPPSADTDGLESMEFVYDIWDHGADVGISPPPADEIITEDELGFSLEDMGDLGG